MKCPLCNTAAPLFHKRSDPRYGPRTYFRCPACRLIFLHPEQRLSPGAEKARYDEHHNDPGDPDYVNFLRRLGDPVLERLPYGAEGLDYGCGPGPAMHVIFEPRGHTIRNYDPFYNPDPRLLEERYDFVVCSETVEHFYRPGEEFQRMNRLLRSSGGLIGVMTSILLREADFADWWYIRDGTHVCFYQPMTFHYIASMLGMEIEFPVKNVVILSR